MGRADSERAAKRPSVTIVSQFYAPDPSATAYFLTDIAEGLAARGFTVEVLTAQPSYEHGLATCPSAEVVNGVSIQRVEIPEYSRQNLPRRLLVQLAFTLAVARKLRTQRSTDLVFTVTCPPFTTWLNLLVRNKSAHVALIHDVYPEIVTALRRSPAPALLPWALIERAALRRCSGIVTLGECQRKVIADKLGKHGPAVTVIPNWAKSSVELATPVPRQEHPLLSRLGIAGKFVIQYSGNLGLFHGLEILPAVIRSLPPERFHVLIVGGGQKRAWLEGELAGASHVTYLPHQPEPELASSLAACDVALVCLHPDAVGLCVPSKLYGSLAVGRAVCVVADSASEPARTVTRHGCGVVTQYSAAAVTSALLALERDRELVVTLGQRARTAYVQHYQREFALDRYAEQLRACAPSDNF